MIENNERKLHPATEFLIITGIILLCSLCSSFVMSKIISGKSYSEIEGTMNIFGWVNMLFPFIASFVCFKLIEHRKTNIFKILVIVLSVALFCNYIQSITTIYIAPFGAILLAKFSYINYFTRPVGMSFLIILFVYVFDLPKTNTYIFDSKMYISLFKHILLLLFTLGIWHLVWIYRTTKYLNCIEDEENRNPSTKLLLCMFVPFYVIYWTYKSALRVDKLSKSVNITSDLAVPCLLLEIFMPIIPPVLIQDKINKIITSNLNISQ